MGSLVWHNVRLRYKRWDRYWTSQEGRGRCWALFKWGIAGVGGGKVAAGGLLATFLVPATHQLYQTGTREEVELPEALEALALDEYLASDMPIPSESHRQMLARGREANAASFFVSRSSVPVGLGYPYNFSGAFIGLPLTLAIRTREEAEAVAESLSLGGRRPEPSHPAFPELVDSLLLSDAARRFAVMQQIQLSKRWHSAYFEGCLFTAFPSVAALLCYGVSNLFQLHQRKLRWVRVAVYAVVWTTALRSLVAVRDNANAKHVLVADRDTALYGASYISGGLEWLGQLRRRNAALQAAVGGSAGLGADGDYALRPSLLGRLLHRSPVSLAQRTHFLREEQRAFERDPQRYALSREAFWSEASGEAAAQEEWAQTHQYEDSLIGAFHRWKDNPAGK